jgi:DNA-binding LacI/PurR family transcriptional regulator
MTEQNHGVGRVTLQTIADRVGVSRMTVSNAFSRPDQLSSELRNRILETADALGYAGPDPSGRALARGTTSAVGVLLTDRLHDAFTDEVAAMFLGAIAEELAPTGLSLTLLSSSGRADVVPARDVPMDGALVYSCDTESPALDWLRRRKLPIVFVDQAPVAGIPSVNIDDRGGAAAAAQHLVDRGHRRIGIVTANMSGPEGVVPVKATLAGSYVSIQRMLGWCDALDAAGIVPTIVQQRRSGTDTGRRGARLLLGGDEAPTGVLCFSDATAFGVVQEAEALGYSTPTQLSVVGFDDNPIAETMRPPLTTVRQDLTAKGQAAAAALVATIKASRNGSRSRARHTVLPTQLVVRQSTAAPR